METKTELFLLNNIQSKLIIEAQLNTYEDDKLVASLFIANFSAEDLTPAKDFLKSLVDTKTQLLIFKGFYFAELTWSLSITAQINWSNLPNLTQEFFNRYPDGLMPLLSKEDKVYFLSFDKRMDFYFAAVDGKNNPLQSGGLLKYKIDGMTTPEEICNFKDPR